MKGPETMAPATRKVLAQLAEKMVDAGHAIIALLDTIEGDPDLEDDDPAGEEVAE
ncbi:MAG: hypothetical protein V2I39_11640 [Erythrobacter sp.]|jgi:hypothetical protein|nr:hypothetical protein [Erythrobacter sp.]